MIKIKDFLTEEESKEDYPELHDTFKKELGLTNKEASIAVSITTGVCSSCWADTKSCQCRNDE